MKPSTMKSFLPIQGWLLALATVGALGLPSASQAFPPAPYHRIFGLVRDEYGEPLSLAGAQIIFSVEGSNGVQITASIVPNLEPGVNYRLSLAMDSGAAPDLYKPTALKPLAPFRIRVKIGATIYLPIEMAANYANLGKPAQSTRIDLTIGEDADGDGLPDAWQRLLIAMLGPGAKIGPQDDADGDGISNLDEYLAGTYAFDPANGFRLNLVPGAGGAPLLEFMVISPRTYTVFSSTNLETWAPMEFRIPGSGPDAPSLPNYRATDVRTLQVEPILSSGVPSSRYFYKVLAQ
jgi:hypothetical protein